MFLNACPSLKIIRLAGTAGLYCAGHVDPVGVLRAGIGLARQRERAAHLSLGDAFARERVGSELIVAVGVRRLRFLSLRPSAHNAAGDLGL